MRATADRNPNIAVGAVGRYIPYEKLPFGQVVAREQQSVVMVHWVDSNSLFAVKWLIFQAFALVDYVLIAQLGTS